MANAIASFKSNVRPWKELSRSTVFEKFGRAVVEVVYELPTGQQDTFYIKSEPPAACILALTEQNNVVMVRQYRPGPHEVLLELPGGYVDRGESPTEAMRRELLEETGYDGNVSLVATAFDDAYSTLTRTCFVATNCKKVQEPRHEATEFIEVVETSLDEFRELLRSGRMTDIEVGYLGLDYLKIL
jgi:ADP-ribose pyrophosphatase